MPFSIPTKFSYPWADVLNRHLAQLMNPSTGGLNVWDIRPTVGVNGQSLGPDHVGFTGYNSTSRAFERWNGSGWDVLTSSGASSTVMPVWNSTSRPSAPSTGDFGFNTSTKQIERWSGTTWQPVASSDLEIWNTATRPILSGEQMGKVGFNSTTRQIERWNGSAWENVTSPVVPPLATWSSVTRPALSAQDAGQFGFNTTTKQVERWNGGSWDNVTPPVDASSMVSTMPSWSNRPSVTSADAGRFGYNTSTKKIERFDGSNWIDVSPRSDTPFGMGSWNTSSRPLLTAGDAGVFGYNTDTLRVERWNGSSWVSVTDLSNGTPLIPFWSTASRPNLTAADVGRTGFNTTTNQLETWNGSNWVSVAPNASLSSTGSQASSIPTWTSSSRPTSPVPGTLGYNSTLPGLEVWNGSAWVPANSTTGGGAATLPQWTSSTRPTSPSIGTMGYNTQTGSPEMWNGSGWVPLNNPPADYRPTYQTWTDSTRPTNVPVGTVGYNSGTNQLEMWNGSSWQPISGGIPRHANRPLSPAEGYTYYNTGTDVVEYWNGTEWITLSKSGVTSGGAGSSWENPLQVNSNTTGQAGKYYLLDPANGPFEFMLPSNPAVGTEVCIRGLTSALTNSVFINPNGKKFLGSTSRRVYSGTTPICITYIDETTGWSPSAAIPIEVVVEPPPADTGIVLDLKSNLGLFRTPSNRIYLWSGEVNSNPYEMVTSNVWNAVTYYQTISDATTIDSYQIGPTFESNSINGRPSLRFQQSLQGVVNSFLADTNTPPIPRKYTLFIVASTENRDNPSTLLSSVAISITNNNQTLGLSKGFSFYTWGIAQYTPTDGQGAPASSLVIPISKRPPNNTFTVFIYQIDYDNSIWRISDSKGDSIAIGSFASMNNDGQRLIALGEFCYTTYIGDRTFGNTSRSSCRIAQATIYNNLLTSSQIAAVCNSLRTTYNLSHMI